MSTYRKIQKLMEGYSHQPVSARVLQSQAQQVIEKARNEGVFDGDGDVTLAELIDDWARKHDVATNELASFVFREARRRGLIG